MQATQSGTASGTWCRTEQFSALRYVSQHHVSQHQVSQHQGRSGSSPGEEGAEENWTPLRVTQAAGELMRSMRLCNERLTQVNVSSLELAQGLAELHHLKAQSWTLVDHFWRMTRRRQEMVPAKGSSHTVLEQGAAGWIAC